MGRKNVFTLAHFQEAETLFVKHASDEDFSHVKELFDAIDDSGDGIVCLTDFYDEMKQKHPCLANKDLILKAYTYAVGVKFGSIEAFVDFKEMKHMLAVMATWGRCQFLFRAMDSDSGSDISLMEFKKHSYSLMGIGDEEAQRVFDSIDDNGNGSISFDEFAMWLCEQRGIHAKKRDKKTNASIMDKAHRLRKKEYQQLLDKVREMNTEELNELYNKAKRNGTVTLHDMWIYLHKHHHCLSHKAAFSAALKKTIGQRDRVIGFNNKVARADLKYFLHNLVIATRINFLYEELDFGNDDDDVDGIQLEEFVAAAPRVLDVSAKESRRIFNEIDRNGGGTVNTHEFSRWAIQQKNLAPELPPPEKVLVHGGVTAQDYTTLWEQLVNWFTKDGEEDLREVYAAIDDNGNGAVTVLEVYEYLAKRYPCLYYQQGILLAYRKASGAEDNERVDHTDWVDWDEFKLLLRFFVIACKIKFIFDSLDRTQVKRVSVMDFKDLGPGLFHISQIDAINEFKKIDRDGSGKINFKEFYDWAIKKKPSYLGLGGSKRKDSKVIPPHSKVTLKDYDTCDDEIKALIAEEGQTTLRGMYEEVTETGEMRTATLGKLYTALSKRWNCLYHKNNVRLAYKAANNKDKSKVTDYNDIVGYETFVRFLPYFSLYARVWWVFDRIDAGGDANIVLDEFRNKASPFLGISKRDCQKVFMQIDKNSSGSINFNEFCRWAIPRWGPDGQAKIRANTHTKKVKKKVKKKKTNAIKKAEDLFARLEKEETEQITEEVDEVDDDNWDDEEEDEIPILNMDVAHTELLQSFSIAIKRMQGQMDANNRIIQRYRESNKLMEHEINASLSDLRENYHLVQEKEVLLGQSVARNEDVTEQLQQVTELYEKQKDIAREEQEKQRELEQINLRLLTVQVAKQEGLNNINSDMGAMMKEIQQLEADKTRYKKVKVELEQRLLLEKESFVRERAGWKDSTLKTMSELQAAESEVRDAKKKATDLANAAVDLTMEYEAKEATCQKNKKQLEKLHGHLERVRQDIVATRDANQRLLQRAAEGQSNKETIGEDIERSETQLKAMAEKVFTLMQQIKQHEAYKEEADRRYAHEFQVMNDLNAQQDGLRKKLDSIMKIKDKKMAEASSIKERIKQNTQAVSAYTVQHETVAIQKNHLEQKLKFRESMLEELSSSHTDLSQSCKTEQAQRADLKKSLSQLGSKVKELEVLATGLKNRVHNVEAHNAKTEKAVSRKLKALNKCKKREEHCQILQEQLANALKPESVRPDFPELTPLALNDPAAQGDVDTDHIVELDDKDKPLPRSVIFAQRRLAVAKKANGGHELKELLKKMKISESTACVWMADITRMVEGLLGFYQSYKVHTDVQKKAKSTIAGKSTPLRSLTAKNTELMQRLQVSEEHKTKAIMRLVQLLEVGGGGSGDGGANGNARKEGESTEAQQSFFITQEAEEGVENPDDFVVNDNEGEDTEMEPKQPALTLNALQLSDNGVEDGDMNALATTLGVHPSITEVDLRGNRISTYGLLTLANQCITDSGVTLLDLQQNNISLDGLEALCLLVLSHSKGGGNLTDPATAPTPTSKRPKQLTEEMNEEGTAKASTEGEACAVVSACLRKDNNALLPIVEVTTKDKTLVIDLRYNRLQRTHAGSEKPNSTMMKKTLALITKLLASTSKPEAYRVNTISDGFTEYDSWKKGAPPPALLIMEENPEDEIELDDFVEREDGGWVGTAPRERGKKKQGSRFRIRKKSEVLITKTVYDELETNGRMPMRSQAARLKSNPLGAPVKAKGLEPIRSGRLSSSASTPILGRNRNSATAPVGSLPKLRDSPSDRPTSN